MPNFIKLEFNIASKFEKISRLILDILDCLPKMDRFISDYMLLISKCKVQSWIAV